MTRLITDGAESGDLLRLAATGYGTSITNSIKRTGSYAYGCGSYQFSDVLKYVLPANVNEVYIRFASRASTIGPGSSLLRWLNSSGTQIGTLKVSASAPTILSVYDNVTERVSTAALNWNANEWHVIELHVKLGGAGVGKFEVKFDGTLVATFTGITNTNGSAINTFWFGSPTFAIYPSVYLDDIAINDIAGGTDNSWCGDGGVLAALVPVTGAAEYTDLIASTGDAWECVNEIPANADYVYESTVDKKSTYLLSDLAGLPGGASIARVWVELDALETAADGDKIATLLRSAATDAQGADQALTLAYVRYLSAEYLVDPAGGEDPTWSEAKVNALQAGAVVR